MKCQYVTNHKQGASQHGLQTYQTLFPQQTRQTQITACMLAVYDKQFNDQFSMNTQDSTQRSQRTEQSRQPETPIMKGDLKTIV